MLTVPAINGACPRAAFRPPAPALDPAHRHRPALRRAARPRVVVLHRLLQAVPPALVAWSLARLIYVLPPIYPPIAISEEVGFVKIPVEPTPAHRVMWLKISPSLILARASAAFPARPAAARTRLLRVAPAVPVLHLAAALVRLPRAARPPVLRLAVALTRLPQVPAPPVRAVLVAGATCALPRCNTELFPALALPAMTQPSATRFVRQVTINRR